LNFAAPNFFLFLVGRNSSNFAPARSRKLFAGWRMGCRGGAKLSEFRSGGGAKLSSGGAKFVCTAIDFGELSRAADCARKQMAHPLRFAALKVRKIIGYGFCAP
jgi:hypothetical protein